MIYKKTLFFYRKIILNGYGSKAYYIDRKIIKSYIIEYFNEYSFNERNEFIYSFDDNYHYKFVLNKSIKEYITIIKVINNKCKQFILQNFIIL